MGPMRGWTDKQAEQVIGNLLRAGVFAAAAVVVLGGVFYLIRFGGTAPHFSAFRGKPVDLRSVSKIVEDAFALRRRAIIQFGLLMLIATPVARVAFSIVVFALQRDHTYIIVTSIVLSILLFSLIGGQDVTIRVFPKANHGIWQLDELTPAGRMRMRARPSEFWGLMLNWAKKRAGLGPSRPPGR
jgi:uncharacterized membrane protein